MITKDLIKELNEADPSGMLHCCVDNVDIYFVSVEPAYYDGCLQVLRIDESKKPYYCVVGGDYIGSGHKLNITTHSIRDMLHDNPDAPVGYIGMSEESAKHYRDNVEKTRLEVHRMLQDLENERFADYVLKRLGISKENNNENYTVELEAWQYAENNLKHDAPMPERIRDSFYVDEGTSSEHLHKITKETKTGNPKQPTIKTYLSWDERRRKQWSETLFITMDKNGTLEIHKRG